MRQGVTVLAVLATCSTGFGNLLLNPSFQDPAFARLRIRQPVVDGDWVAIDTAGANRIYEFDVAGNGVTPPNILVDVVGDPSADNAATQLAAAINADGLSPATAETDNVGVPNEHPDVLLTWDGAGGNGAQNSSSADGGSGARLQIDDFNEKCRQNHAVIIGWEGSNRRRNGDVFIPGPYGSANACPDGEHASLQGSGGQQYIYQTVIGLDPTKTYLLTGVWTIGDYAPACTYNAEVHDGTDPQAGLIAETTVTLESGGKYNWLPFAVAGSPSGTEMTVVLRAVDTGGNSYAMHVNDVSLVELEDPPCTPPTVSAFSPNMLFRGTTYQDSIVINGSGFMAGQTTVRLEGDDVPDIEATDVQVQTSDYLYCTLDIPPDAPYGNRSVVVEVAGCGGNALAAVAYVLASGPFRNGSFEQQDPGYNACPVLPQGPAIWWDAVEINSYGGITKLFRDDLPAGAPFLPSCDKPGGQWPPDGWHYAATASDADGSSSPENFIFQTFEVSPNEQYTFSGYFAGGGNNTIHMEMRDGTGAGNLLARTQVYGSSSGGSYDWTFNAIGGRPTGDLMTVGWRVFVDGDPPHASYGDDMQVEQCVNPPTVDGTITPSNGDVGTTVHITDIPGSGYSGTPIVLFRQGNLTTIVAQNVEVSPAGDNISCDVDLTGVPLGLYDVIVIQNGCFVDDALVAAFEVVCPIPLATLASIDTGSGVNTETDLTLTITGTDLDTLSGVKLVRSGGGWEIAGSLGPAGPGATTRDATFDLTGAQMGRYNLVPEHQCPGVGSLDRVFLVYLPAPDNTGFETGTVTGEPTDAWCVGGSLNPGRTPDKSRPLNWDEPTGQADLSRDTGLHTAPCPLPEGDHFAGLPYSGSGTRLSFFQTFAVQYGQSVSVTASFTGGTDAGCDPHTGTLKLLDGDELTGAELDSAVIDNANGSSSPGAWEAETVGGTASGDKVTVVITMDLSVAGSCDHALHTDNVIIELGAGCHDPFADADEDGDVDQEDFGALEACITGPAPGNPPIPEDPAYCVCFDRPEEPQGGEPPVRDGAIDQQDISRFEACASGPGIMADETCDDLE